MTIYFSSSKCFCFAAVLLSACPLAGCSSSQYPTVEGEVTLDGQPLQEGGISFVPLDGQTPTAGGSIQDGRYSLEVPPGTKRIEITATKVIGQRQAYEGDPNSPMIDITESLIPERFNMRSELQFDVKPGVNTKDFHLESS